MDGNPELKILLQSGKTFKGISFCKNCGKEIIQVAKQKPKRFCCDKCRILWWNCHLDQVKRKAYYQRQCPYCGKVFQAYGDKSRKFCSLECYKKFVLQQAKYHAFHKAEIRKKQKYKYIQDWELIDKQKISRKWLKVLNQLDHELYLNEKYQTAMRDPVFEKKMVRHYVDPGAKYVIDPWATLYNCRDSVETAIFPEQEAENQEVALVRRFIEEECTEEERDLIYRHFGQRMKLTEICKIKTKRNVTAKTLSKRKCRILDKVAKLLGVTREKKRRQFKSKGGVEK